jgi:hypothetical protein
VIVKSASGESNCAIAEDLGIARNTVARILNEAEMSSLVDEGCSRVHTLIPKAIDAIEDALDKKNANIGVTLLSGTGVLVTKSKEEVSHEIKLVLLNRAFRPKREPLPAGETSTLP